MRPLQPIQGIEANIPRPIVLVVHGSFYVPAIKYSNYPNVISTVKVMGVRKETKGLRK